MSSMTSLAVGSDRQVNLKIKINYLQRSFTEVNMYFAHQYKTGSDVIDDITAGYRRWVSNFLN